MTSATSLFLAAFALILLALSVIDLRTQRLPDVIVLPTLWAGLLLNASSAALVPAADAVLGAACGYASLWLLAVCWRLRTTNPAFGGGDLKLLAAIGAWLGVNAIPAVLLFAFASGTVATLPLLLRARVKLSQRVPFGPALVAAALLTMLLGPTLGGFLSLGPGAQASYTFF